MKDRRNVAVIAHVDHGKTTLSDALLHRAGVLSADKAGDQNRGRELDTSKEERERGITIKATGITLDYQLDAELMARGDTVSEARILATMQLQPVAPTPVKDKNSSTNDGLASTTKEMQADDAIPSSGDNSDSDGDDFELYVGNLPRSADPGAILDFLRALVDIPDDAAIGINMNSRRLFAFVTVPIVVGQTILAVASGNSGVVVCIILSYM